MSLKGQQGSIVTYIMIAIFLAGVLVAAMTQGSKKSADSAQIDSTSARLTSDIKVIHSVIGECVQVYNIPADIDADGDTDTDDNPNAPFPLYSNLTGGGSGVPINEIKCPGTTSSSEQTLFTGTADDRFKLISDTSIYTTTYVTDTTEGVYIRISSTIGDAVWKETIARFNEKKSTCSAAIVTDAGTCINDCLYYWILRRSTSTIGGEAGCP